MDRKDIQLSEYANQLEHLVKLRYIQKISVIDCDPFLVSPDSFDPNCLPSIEAVDLVSFLVLEQSFYSKQTFKNYKSLQAYNQVVSKFVTSVQGKRFKDSFLVLGKVLHSQKVKEKPVQCWIITDNGGTVLSAHCLCMAGLGECCTHIASILFYIELWNRFTESQSCTQKQCSWIIPTGVPTIEYKQVKDIDFKSALKLKQEIEQHIDGQIPTKVKDARPVLASVADISPSEIDLNTLFDKLSDCQHTASILSLSKKHSALFLPESQHIKKITDLFDEKLLECNYLDLLNTCENTEISISDEDISIIERETRLQSKGNSFFLHRAGRVGASLCHQASQTSPAQPAISLIKTICYPKELAFSSRATEHGIKHEQTAIDFFVEFISKTHKNFKAEQCGLFINKDYPYLHATPDFLYSCDCCEETGCGEVKCPFSLYNTDFLDYLNSKNSCFYIKEGVPCLKREHAYYFQVQQQLFTLNKDFCYFIVFGFKESKEHTLCFEKVPKDIHHWNTVVPRLHYFWRFCILPEVVARWYTRKGHLINSGESGNIQFSCLCMRVTTEETIKCKNHSCSVINFHPSCLKIQDFTVKESWLCPLCRTLDSNKSEQSQEICLCSKKVPAAQIKTLLKCLNQNCTNGKYFHLECLGLKRKPNNYKTKWLCNNCRVSSSSQPVPIDVVIPTHESSSSQPVPINDVISSSNQPEETRDFFYTHDSHDLNIKRYPQWVKLTEKHFGIIAGRLEGGWLDDDIINDAQMLIKQCNNLISGFQQTALGVFLNFEIMTSEFIQILNTGQHHWVCVSSIGCAPGVVNLFDSYFTGIDNMVISQIKCFMGEDLLKVTNVVPVQKQENNSDCGLFAIAFATCLTFQINPENVIFDCSQMRNHLKKCLTSGKMEPFPSLS